MNVTYASNKANSAGTLNRCNISMSENNKYVDAAQRSVSLCFSDLDEMGFRLYFSMTSSLPQKWGGQLTLLPPHSEKWGGHGLPGPLGSYAYAL